MSNVALRIEDLGKLYRIGGQQERYRTFRDAIATATTAPIRRVRDLLRGQAYGAANLQEEIWALRDVSFEVKHGEVVGIIGRNGAGKSTLLKILSRITEPTTGYAKIYGRLGALLEVGTGFHPELTGRENIYLNGAILGMSRYDIDRKFDEIVDFAGVEKFIDTPVKHYSSGMGLRLGFAVAAHLEPDILVVDEVLAVGDAEFQKKCLGKMSQVAGEGRTVLFVSHNMAAVQSLCSRSIMLSNGSISLQGSTEEVIKAYMETSLHEDGSERLWNIEKAPGGDEIRIIGVRAYSDGKRLSPFPINQPVHLEVDFVNLVDGNRFFVVFQVKDTTGIVAFEAYNSPEASDKRDLSYCKPTQAGSYRTTCTIPPNFLNDDQYNITTFVASAPPPVVLARALEAISFTIYDTGDLRAEGLSGKWAGLVRTRFDWKSTRLASEVMRLPNTAIDSHKN